MFSRTKPIDLSAETVAAFLSRVKPQESGCHYLGGQSSTYANFRGLRASRMALAIKLGRDIGHGKFACHHCDNPPCVNPEHLYEGTPLSNSCDAHARKRGFNRTNYPNAKHPSNAISRDAILDIAARGDAGEYLPSIAARHGVTLGTVQRIVEGKSWRWITGRNGHGPVGRVRLALEHCRGRDFSTFPIRTRHMLELALHNGRISDAWAFAQATGISKAWLEGADVPNPLEMRLKAVG